MIKRNSAAYCAEDANVAASGPSTLPVAPCARHLLKLNKNVNKI
jgi:hypothetical protein